MGAIAFFDVDKTVLSRNSAALWVRRERRLGNLSLPQALRGVFWAALYELGLIHADDLIRDAARTLKGRAERDVVERTLAFWHDEVAALIRPGARAAIASHRERGDRCWLLTSTSCYLSEPVVDALQLDGYLANRFVVEAGTFTGDMVDPICFGAGKRTHAELCAASAGVPLAECSFYTDSLSDLPALLAVGHPVAVNPDPRLRREARRRGWPIEDWGAPSLPALPPAARSAG
ncbi:MAG: HAD family hydrolase [Deltaproteobacteria bacterium]|nr:HAD family hydrolase [Deltaproteobacteria bacterium]